LINNLISLYSPSYIRALVYLLEKSKYRLKPYLGLLNKTKDFKKVIKTHKPLKTKTNTSWLMALRLGILIQLIIGAFLIYSGIKHTIHGGIYFGLAVIVCYPLVWAYIIGVVLFFGKWQAEVQL